MQSLVKTLGTPETEKLNPGADFLFVHAVYI